MRVKEIEKTANVAWSPAIQHPVYLAAGTAAQQLDATFSTSAALEIYELDLTEPGLEMKCAGFVPCDLRFHKLAWGAFGINGSSPNGVIAGGADNGNLLIWNPQAIIRKEEALIEKLDKHTGSVAALDFNPFQCNLLASGGSESEIYIWDLNNTSNPMTPGQKSQPPDDVTCVGWNRQVQHIMASTYAGRCVVWDLRKNEPIIKVSDSMSRIKCKLLSWHPDVATQLCLASEDDHNPVVQLWDLRFASSPLKVLENHQRGILSMAWCQADSDLLITCGKDNRILVWNPNSQAQMGEVVYELPTTNQWSFDVQWCPRNPAIVSSCAFDGHISVYSLMGGSAPPPAPSSKIADSFGSDSFGQSMPQPQAQEEKQTPVMLKKPPKWLRRPVGASFGFGGKLVTFESCATSKQASQPQAQHQGAHTAQPREVIISQVVTEVDLVARSNQLENALKQGQYHEFCAMKIANSKTDIEENVWNFLKGHFERDSRTRFLELLGYNKDDVSRKIADDTGSDVTSQAASGVNANELANEIGRLNVATPSDQSVSTDGADAFELIASKSDLDRSGSEASSDVLHFSTDDDSEGLITKALLTANFPAAVEVCLHTNRLAEAVILAMAGGPELVKQTQARVFEKQQDNLSKVISSVVNNKYVEVVRTCNIHNWKEALAIALTYSQPHEFAALCDILGERLEAEGDASLAANACLCYVCAGNLEKLVGCWNKHVKNGASPAALQDLVEKVMVLRKAIESSTGQEPAVESGVLAQKLSQYAELLAAQGCASTAISYLDNSNEISLATLRYRLFNALPYTQGMQAPAQPFNAVDIQPAGAPARAPVASAAATSQQQPAYTGANSRARANSGHNNAYTNPGHYTTTSTTSMYGTGSYAGYSQAPSTYPQRSNVPPYSAPKPTPTPAYGQGGNYPQEPYNSYGPNATNTSPYGPGSSQQQPYMYTPNNSTSSSAYTPDMIIQNLHTLTGARRPSEGEDPDLEGNRNSPNKGAPHPVSSSNNAPMPTSYQADQRPAPSGWNDPPPLKESKKKLADTSSSNTNTAAPITQPIYNPAAHQSTMPEHGAPGGPTGYYGGASVGGVGGAAAGGVGGGAVSAGAGGYYNPQQYQPNQMSDQQAQVAAQRAREAAAPKPVQKGPVPAEHAILQTVLDSLAKQCLEKSNNPHIKRKLEDVLRKLETLYDKLRENTLSQSVTDGLHHIIRAIQAFDYQTALGYHAQMVSQGNFSEISSFMPGVKMLMQTASQMQVYIQQ